MEGRVNYLLVGIFVTLFITGIFTFAFWLMKYNNYEQMDRYIVYFNESVAGLNKDSSVKYLGVDAGVVEDIKVASHDEGLVAVYLKINHDIKIKTDMKATLKFYGMTGLAYVEISGEKSDAPLLKQKGSNLPVIHSSPSVFAKIDVTLAKLADDFSLTLQSIQTLLDNKNLKNIESSLKNINELTTELKSNKKDISTLIKKGIKIEKKAIDTLEKFDRIAYEFDTSISKNIQKSLKEFRYSAKELSLLIHHVDKTLKRGDYNIKEISDPIIFQLSSLIRKLELLSDKMDETIDQFNQNPSDLLFKKTPLKRGPGE